MALSYEDVKPIISEAPAFINPVYFVCFVYLEEDTMKNEQRIVIGDRILTHQELLKEEEEFRKERAKLFFEQKIKIFVELQNPACEWGKRKDI